ncbi:unnamed protein product [Sphagnum balticum]
MSPEDSVSDSEQKSESEALEQTLAPGNLVIEAYNPGDVDEGSKASGELLMNAIALNRQASSPLPSISNSTDQTYTALGESSRDSEQVLQAHCPLQLENWHVTQQGDTEGSRDTESVSGGEARGDLAPIWPVSRSGSEPVQGDKVAGDAISQVSVPTLPVKGSDESGAPAGVPSMSLNKGYSRSSSLGGGSMDSSQNRWSISPTRSFVQLVAHGTARVSLPLGVNGTVVAVYDDEPTSIIAYALTSSEYQTRLQNVDMEKPRVKDEDREGRLQLQLRDYLLQTRLKQGGIAVKELDLVVMENLFYGRHTTRLYDLKGSKQSRYNADASGMIKVLLDQNMIENMPTAPIFVNNKAKLVFDRAVYNDTSFLAKVNVTD